MIPVMIGVIVIVFTITYFTPGDPVINILGSGYTPEKYAAKQAELGLDKPYLIQLVTYIWNAFTKFDLGISFNSNIPISHELANRIPISFKLSLAGLALMVVVGLPLGILSALKQYSILDTALTSVALIFAAIPSYVLALLCAVIFGVVLRWLPLSGLNTWKAWLMPVGSTAFGGVAVFMRMSRTTMLEVIRQDYIRTARSKGLKESLVIRRHALKNCMIPLITVLGAFVATLLSGSIIVETIFAIPGVGMYMMSGIIARDYPVINGTVLIIALFVCCVTLIVDIAYGFIDPRVKAHFISPKKKAKAIQKVLETEVEAG